MENKRLWPEEEEAHRSLQSEHSPIHNPQNYPTQHDLVVEHELGAISQGITRIRITRALQSQEESMSLVFDRNGKSPQRREELAYL